MYKFFNFSFFFQKMSTNISEKDRAMIQKEEDNVKNLLEAAKREMKAVKEVNAVNLKKAIDIGKSALAIPLKSRKVALLYRRALKEKKQLLGLEPQTENPPQVNIYILIYYFDIIARLITYNFGNLVTMFSVCTENHRT